MHNTYNNKPLRFCFEGSRSSIDYKINKLIDLIDTPLGLYGKTVKIEEKENKLVFQGFPETLGILIKSTPAFPFMVQLLNEQLLGILNRESKQEKKPPYLTNGHQAELEDIITKTVYCIGEKGGPDHPAYPVHYKLEVLERPNQTEVNLLLQSNLAKEKISSDVLFELRKRLFND